MLFFLIATNLTQTEASLLAEKVWLPMHALIFPISLAFHSVAPLEETCVIKSMLA